MVDDKDNKPTPPRAARPKLEDQVPREEKPAGDGTPSADKGKAPEEKPQEPTKEATKPDAELAKADARTSEEKAVGEPPVEQESGQTTLSTAKGTAPEEKPEEPAKSATTPVSGPAKSGAFKSKAKAAGKPQEDGATAEPGPPLSPAAKQAVDQVTPSSAGGTGPTPPSAGRSGRWLSARRLRWTVAALLAVVLVVSFYLLIDSHNQETADLVVQRNTLEQQVVELNAELAAEREAAEALPSAVAALEAAHTGLADIEAAKDATQAEIEELNARRAEAKKALAAAQSGREGISQSIVKLDAERSRLESLVLATKDELTGMIEMLEGLRSRLSE